MQIISGTTDFNITEPTAVILGKFDGVHLGHQLLVAKLLEQKEKGLKTVVFTFDKSPASLFIQDGDAYRELYTPEEKRNVFEKTGVDIYIEFPMNEKTASISADKFVTEIFPLDIRVWGTATCSFLIRKKEALKWKFLRNCLQEMFFWKKVLRKKSALRGFEKKLV